MKIDATDVALVMRAKAGDRQALADLCERCRIAVYGKCLDFLHDHWLAEDVTQSVLAKVLVHLDTLKQPGTFPRWLFVVTERMCQDAAARANREAPIYDVVSPRAIRYLLGEYPCQ